MIRALTEMKDQLAGMISEIVTEAIKHMVSTRNNTQ